MFRSGNRRGPSNLELAIMLGNLNPNSTTRPCTQCSKEVPKTQVLLTCDKCREKKKRQKSRRKERDIAIAEGRGKGANQGFSSAPLQAVVAKQEQETAARRASARKEGSKSDAASEPASISSHSMGMVFQAILDEHQRDSSSSKPAPKKKPTKKATRDDSEEALESLEDFTNLLLFGIVPTQGGSSSGTKRKLQEVEPSEPGTIYNAETAKKRMRGDMPMQKLEPIPQAASSTKTSTSKPLPLSRQSSNLARPTKTESGDKPQKTQASLAGWLKPTPKSTA